MKFPIEIESVINLDNTNLTRTVILHGGLTVLLGPNGSGKTHLMRGMKNSLASHCVGKKVRFLSAGRVGLFEQYRSDFDGYRGGIPNYQEASYGSVGDAGRRHAYETLQGDFQTLAVRPDILIKIRERLRKLFGRDILVLAERFLRNAAARNGKPPPTVPSTVAERLLSYTWPGNVRELENCIERAVSLARFSELTVDDLPERVRNYRAETFVVAADDPSEIIPLEELERRYIARVVRLLNGNKSRAAQLLGLDRRTLHRRLERSAEAAKHRDAT